jgi:MYXO-CTERM domain-containing protein
VYDPALDAFMPDTGNTTRDAGGGAALPGSCGCRASRRQRRSDTVVAMIALSAIIAVRRRRR